MKTPEEVLILLNEHSCYDGPKKENGAPGPCPVCIQNLIEFAEERVKENQRERDKWWASQALFSRAEGWDAAIKRLDGIKQEGIEIGRAEGFSMGKASVEEKRCEESYVEGLEEAAKVVESFTNQTRYADHPINKVLETIAKKIRALK